MEELPLHPVTLLSRCKHWAWVPQVSATGRSQYSKRSTAAPDHLAAKSQSWTLAPDLSECKTLTPDLTTSPHSLSPASSTCPASLGSSHTQLLFSSSMAGTFSPCPRDPCCPSHWACLAHPSLLAEIRTHPLRPGSKATSSREPSQTPQPKAVSPCFGLQWLLVGAESLSGVGLGHF